MATAQSSVVPREGLASINEASRFLKVCRASVYSMIRDGQLPSTSIRNARRVPWPALHKISDDAMKATENAKDVA